MMQSKLRTTIKVLAIAVAALLGVTHEAQAVNSVYYSVGTSTADLKTTADTLYMTIATGTATFDEAQANNIGVGDEITYNTTSICYISGRTSSTVYSVVTKLGAAPSNVTDATVNSIKRAFNLLSTAETNSSNASHLNTLDLTTSPGYILNLPCYNDGAMDNTVTIDGWTTSTTTYINVYAPATTSEVGTSQRHNGTAGSGFRLVPVKSTSEAATNIISVKDLDVRVTGIEVDGTSVTNGLTVAGIQAGAPTTTGDVRIDKCIIHDITTSTVSTTNHRAWGIWQQEGNVKISNCMIYDISTPSGNSGSRARGMDLDETGAVAYVYNNTVLNIKQTAASGGGYARGISQATSTVTAKNNYVGDVNSISSTEPCYSGITTMATNVASDTTGDIDSMSSYTDYFINVTGGSENLHLRNNTNYLWGSYGTDLRSDANLPITDDIDGGTRKATPDIGADEGDAPTFVKLAAFYAYGYPDRVEVVWETGCEIDNVGFDLYRGQEKDGQYQKLNAKIIPGLGDTTLGNTYSFIITDMPWGGNSFFKLEDIDRSGFKSEHGPITADWENNEKKD